MTAPLASGRLRHLTIMTPPRAPAQRAATRGAALPYGVGSGRPGCRRSPQGASRPTSWDGPSSQSPPGADRPLPLQPPCRRKNHPLAASDARPMRSPGRGCVEVVYRAPLWVMKRVRLLANCSVADELGNVLAQLRVGLRPASIERFDDEEMGQLWGVLVLFVALEILERRVAALA